MITGFGGEVLVREESAILVSQPISNLKSIGPQGHKRWYYRKCLLVGFLLCESWLISSNYWDSNLNHEILTVQNDIILVTQDSLETDSDYELCRKSSCWCCLVVEIGISNRKSTQFNKKGHTSNGNEINRVYHWLNSSCSWISSIPLQLSWTDAQWAMIGKSLGLL